jgi:hypothetical protein
MPEIGLFGSEGGVPITGIPTPISALRSVKRCFKAILPGSSSNPQRRRDGAMYHRLPACILSAPSDASETIRNA